MRKVKELDLAVACYHTLISDSDFPKLRFSEFQEKKLISSLLLVLVVLPFILDSLLSDESIYERISEDSNFCFSNKTVCFS